MSDRSPSATVCCDGLSDPVRSDEHRTGGNLRELVLFDQPGCSGGMDLWTNQTGSQDPPDSKMRIIADPPHGWCSTVSSVLLEWYHHYHVSMVS